MAPGGRTALTGHGDDWGRACSADHQRAAVPRYSRPGEVITLDRCDVAAPVEGHHEFLISTGRDT